MITDVLKEDEFRQKLAFWMLENDKGTLLPLNISKEDFALNFPIPQINLIHTQSVMNSDGSVTSLLKGKISVLSSKSRTGKEAHLTFYKIMNTVGDNDPVCVGYIIAY